MSAVIVEQNAIAALKLAERAVILDTGSVAFDGSAREDLDDDRLRAQYLAGWWPAPGGAPAGERIDRVRR